MRSIRESVRLVRAQLSAGAWCAPASENALVYFCLPPIVVDDRRAFDNAHIVDHLQEPARGTVSYSEAGNVACGHEFERVVQGDAENSPTIIVIDRNRSKVLEAGKLVEERGQLTAYSGLEFFAIMGFSSVVAEGEVSNRRDLMRRVNCVSRCFLSSTDIALYDSFPCSGSLP